MDIITIYGHERRGEDQVSLLLPLLPCRLPCRLPCSLALWLARLAVLACSPPVTIEEETVPTLPLHTPHTAQTARSIDQEEGGGLGSRIEGYTSIYGNNRV